MELWENEVKVSDIHSVFESDHREVIMVKGQLTPIDTIRFLDVLLTQYVAVGLGSQFTIRDADMICPITIHHVIPLSDGCLARVPLPNKAA